MRAILNLKLRLFAADLKIELTSNEHAMVATDFETWARAERDPKKSAELASLGRLSRTFVKLAQKRPRARKRRP